MTPPKEAPPQRLWHAVALGSGLLLCCAGAAVALNLLLPPALALPAVTALLVAMIAGLLLAALAAWPLLRRAALLREAVDRSALRYAVFAPDRTLLDRSHAFDMLGTEPRMVPPGVKLDDLIAAIHGRGENARVAVAREIPAHEDAARAEYDHILPDGRVLQISKRRLSGGEVARFGVDVTGARARDLRARAIHESVPAAIWHLDPDGRTLAGNQRLSDLFGGMVPATLMEAGLRQLGEAGTGPFGLPPGQEVEGVLPAKQGMPERRVILVTSSWLPGEGNYPAQAVLMLLDVTRLHAAQAEALQFACHDPLTGLPNRLQFPGALVQLASNADGGSLLLLDLAGLRSVNDALGQVAGDSMLQEAGRRLRDEVGPADQVFRLGGDEFAVIATGLRTQPEAETMAARIQRALAAPLDLGTGAGPIRANIGHARAPHDGREADALHRAAALALAEAKRQGNGAVIAYDAALGERVARRLTLRERLSRAVVGGEFQLVWQVQVDGRSGSLRGAEALLRWPGGPGGSAVSPADFLPEADAAGLMPVIDAWVLEEALRQKAAWEAAGNGPEVIGVNISATSLRDPGFPARVAATLARHGVAPEALEVEIPEDVAACDLDAMAPVLHELTADGVRLSLDDFGGGRSALAHLLRLPVDQVKLDRSIVAGLPGGARERAILRAVATLARGMEIPLLAEGVETEVQRDALLEEGCAVMQGWLFGRGVPASELVSH
ncbi:putative bifunctional diguanylate cyclase/phosphodiesterase [Roseomonas xinghualingensis]|uniref:putative bifunctional diguanylate cyclase/phosphodiesterase n=1 Tax=Roseomonas xinghualingensis TaxID=2986475 RepID=UPI0021F1D5ED|nr:EAL domain-containing protein [Roseomonas sp. SXEYE001]MCV4208075.1 EAL domain-containing protein [Roseomonas sp. SXEYE001]